MAQTMMSRTCAPVALAGRTAAPANRALRTPFSAEWAKKTVSNGIKTRAMMVWQPFNNKMFETFSFLPALSDQEIARQVDYIIGNGWTPCLEFAGVHNAYVNSESCARFGPVSANYFDNRYWTMWKLPMFGCTNGDQVLREIGSCRRAFPDAYIRVAAFDAVRQVQVCSFLVNRPANVRDYKNVEQRQVQG